MLDLSGVPTMTPSGIPDDYARVQTSPDMFGGAQAQGLARLGEGVGAIGQQVDKMRGWYNQVSADDAYNQTADYITKKMHGDPNVQNPDGSFDVGYMGLKGSAALSARPQVMADIDDYIKKQRANLSDPDAIMHFESASRRLRTLTADQIGRHADGQFTQYTNGVNNGTAAVALSRISAAPTDDATFNGALADMKSAYVKESQNIGHNSNKAILAAEQKATRDAMKARALAIGAGDPVGAMAYIKEHQKELGVEYPALYQRLEAKNNQKTGIGAGAGAFAQSNAAISRGGAAAMPVFVQAATAVPGAMSPAGQARTVQIESGFRANPNPGGKYQGYIQAGAPYWQRYGGGGNPFDLRDSAMALARSSAADRQTLSAGLGRAPESITDGELYLAHQQGPAGAMALLRNPDMPAIDALTPAYKGNRRLAEQAIRMNGGDPNAPARDFVNKWTYKFGGNGLPDVTPGGGMAMQMPGLEGMPQASPTAPQPAAVAGVPPILQQTQPVGTAPGTAPAPTFSSPDEKYAAVMADAYQRIMADTTLNDEQRQYAFAHIKEMAQTFAVMEGANERARHRANDNAALDWSTQILGNKFNADTREQILKDPRITSADTKRSLIDLLEKRAGEDPATRAAKYGQGFQPLLKRIVAPDQPEEKISGQQPLLDAYLKGDISDAGLTHLQHVLTSAAEGKTGNQTLMSNALERAKRQMVLNSVEGGWRRQVDDEVGQAKMEEFTHVFIEGAQQVIASGKSIADYTDPKNVDKLMEQVYPRSERVRNALSFGQNSFSAETANKMQPKLPPQGVQDAAWWKEVDAPPMRNGKAPPVALWSSALEILAQNPTPDAIESFNKLFKGTVDGHAILQRLGVIEKQPAPAPAAPPAPPPKPPRAAGNGFADQVARRAEAQAGQPSIGSKIVKKVGEMLPETAPLAPGAPANAMAQNPNVKEAAR